MFEAFLRYNIVGVVNTLFGFGLIIFFMYLGLDAVKSNAVGYGMGAVLSYVLNSKYTFKDEAHSAIKVLKFFLVLAVSYLLNYVVLRYMLMLLNPYVAQVVAAIAYTLSAFVFMRFFVFNEKKI